MWQLILDVISKVIDIFVADTKRREEWKRRVAEALRQESGRTDSSQARDDYSELERRAREGRHDTLDN